MIVGFVRLREHGLRVFPLWLGNETGAGASVDNYIAAAAFLVAITAPFLGTVADLRQRRLPYMNLLTVIAALYTAGLDLARSVLVACALFVAAEAAHHSALVFYNALLPAVSGGRAVGQVSGYGVAVGYVGSILCLMVLAYFVTDAATTKEWLSPFAAWIKTGDQLNSNASLPTAVLFLVLSLPAFFIPNRAVRPPWRTQPSTGARSSG